MSFWSAFKKAETGDGEREKGVRSREKGRSAYYCSVGAKHSRVTNLRLSTMGGWNALPEGGNAIRDAGYGMRETRYGMLDTRCWLG